MMMPKKLKKRDDIDRISSLSDDVLAKILLCLPTKEAVATSVLSRRWGQPYTWLAHLDFNDSPIYHCLRRPRLIDSFPAFKRYVDNVLRASQSQNITTFRLHFGGHWRINFPVTGCNQGCFPDMEPMHINAWLSFPLTRVVRELDICAHVRKPGKLPSAIFGCGTLEVLKLDVNLDLEVPLSLCLPNLKEFHLSLLWFPDDDSVTRLVSSCSSLQHLDLYGDWEPVTPIEISSPSLRRLAIVNPNSSQGPRSKVVLHVPNLEYLEYLDTWTKRYFVGDLNALVKAKVEIEANHDSEIVLVLVSSMSNVRHLFLMERLLEAVDLIDASEFKNKLPVFRNLKHLKVGCCGYYKWNQLLMELLNCAPFLETLTFPQGIRFLGDEDDEGYVIVSELECQSWSSTTQTVPSCLGSHFKRIVMKEYAHTEWELEIVKYFVRNALVLEEVVVVCVPSMVMAARIFYEKLPRASTTCSIKVEEMHD